MAIPSAAPTRPPASRPPPASRRPPAADDVARALGAAVRRLGRLAHPSGTWTDLWLAPGTSSSWVTAVAGVALSRAARDPRLAPTVRREAAATAARAADALAASARDGAWGWSAAVRPDADSTAWAVRLLAATRRPVPTGAWALLAAHDDGVHVRTYTAAAAGAWRDPAPEVTAAALVARLEGGAAGRAELAARWTAAFGGGGPWRSPWWPTSAQPTAVVLDAWHALGRPDPGLSAATGVAGAPRASGAPGAMPADLWVAALAPAAPPGGPGGDALNALVARVLADQDDEGQWPGRTVLTVPAPHPDAVPTTTTDARGVLTTATAVLALLACDVRPAGAGAGAARRLGGARRPGARRPPAARDSRWDGVVRDVAAAAGVDPDAAGEVLASLTRESLAAPSPWPAAQLSSLAEGLPLELSVGGDPALRFACDVGDPRLPPHRRLASGLAALERTAGLLGLGAEWDAVAPVLAALAPADLPVPDGCRFWLWGGADLAPGRDPTLKAYGALHAADVPGWRAREHAALVAAGVPDDAPVHDALRALAPAGFGHQVGLGLAHGRWGLKVYDELAGWQPDVARAVLALCGLPDDVGPLVPDVPGVLRAWLAARRRSGVSLRVVPGTGEVTEVTVTAALPPPLVGREELERRVLAWLPAVGVDPAPLAALLHAVAPAWADAPPRARRLGLLTRTVGRAGTGTTVYVRPSPPPV